MITQKDLKVPRDTTAHTYMQEASQNKRQSFATLPFHHGCQIIISYPLTASFRFFPALKTGTLRAGIFNAAFVLGLIP